MTYPSRLSSTHRIHTYSEGWGGGVNPLERGKQAPYSGVILSKKKKVQVPSSISHSSPAEYSNCAALRCVAQEVPTQQPGYSSSESAGGELSSYHTHVMIIDLAVNALLISDGFKKRNRVLGSTRYFFRPHCQYSAREREKKGQEAVMWRLSSSCYTSTSD